MKNRSEYGRGLGADIRYYADYALEAFNNLERNRKLLFIAGAAVITVILVVLVVFIASPRYTPLYTNIGTQDAASITAYLKDKKIPYKIADEGSTILVPDSQKYQVRLDLANNNLPRGNTVGFESFNQTHFGETQSEQKVRYIVALQGELERTIGRIDGVEDVRVHIVEPDPSLFVQDQKNATASVLLKLKPDYDLQGPQVLGIARLVASGVEGLKPENVTIVDTNGHVLSDSLDNGSQGQLTANQIKIKQDYEKQLEGSLQSMLERVVGPGKAIVRANATINFDQVEINTENYGDKQVRYNRTIEETTTSTAAAQGPPGTSTNIPIYQEVNGQNSSQTQKTDKTTNYEIDKQTERRIVAPGEIKQLSLSVVIDGQIDALQQKQIEGMVASAAGILPDRGDNVTVTGMMFNKEAADKMRQEMDSRQRRQSYLNAFYILLAIMLAFVVLRYARRHQTQKTPDYASGVSVEDLLADKQREMDLEEDRDNETKKLLEQLRQFTRNKPAETVQAFRSWLTGD